MQVDIHLDLWYEIDHEGSLHFVNPDIQIYFIKLN